MSAQRLNALARANVVRLGRADLKRKVISGERTFASLLDEPCCQNIIAFELLQWCPRVGYKRAKDLTRRIGGQPIISETIPVCRVGALTRAELLERLRRVGVQ